MRISERSSGQSRVVSTKHDIMQRTNYVEFQIFDDNIVFFPFKTKATTNLQKLHKEITN